MREDNSALHFIESALVLGTEGRDGQLHPWPEGEVFRIRLGADRFSELGWPEGPQVRYGREVIIEKYMPNYLRMPYAILIEHVRQAPPEGPFTITSHRTPERGSA